MGVYFILNGRKDAVKVGYSTDYKRRLAQLQTANEEVLELFFSIDTGDLSLEKVFHDFLKSKRKHIRGEWFKYDDDVKSYLFDLCTWKRRQDKYGDWFAKAIYFVGQHERSWSVLENAVINARENLIPCTPACFKV